uniref:Uncharacterized protein n=1 Tax=Mimivirus LCMiAC01 TaxID=2506608 RepID=A0A481Z1T6_9VIRU|nr:MAG: uncharacterized protein LCMiAC01_03340 [Mimivirus LCMiAC01]
MDKGLHIMDVVNADAGASSNNNTGHSTSSWACVFEDELGDTINDKPIGNITDDNDNNINRTRSLTIDEIINFKYNDLPDLEILYNEKRVAKYLKDHISNNKHSSINSNDIIDKLQWLMDVSEYFTKKLKLAEYKHQGLSRQKSKDFVEYSSTDSIREANNMELNSIPRSSYKFCRYNYECEFNYNSYNKGCYAQHFVHNMVYADLTVLLEYINNTINHSISEIKKSINTIYFVMNHMYDELNNSHKKKLRRNSSNDLHVDRTPSKHTKKRTGRRPAQHKKELAKFLMCRRYTDSRSIPRKVLKKCGTLKTKIIYQQQQMLHQ